MKLFSKKKQFRSITPVFLPDVSCPIWEGLLILCMVCFLREKKKLSYLSLEGFHSLILNICCSFVKENKIYHFNVTTLAADYKNTLEYFERNRA